MNTVGTISTIEAREALRLHKGNIWRAVTQCIEQRQKKYNDIAARGNFTREDIVTSLTAHHGNMELALIELNKTQLKPFLMKIWGPPSGVDNESGNYMTERDSYRMGMSETVEILYKWIKCENLQCLMKHWNHWRESPLFIPPPLPPTSLPINNNFPSPFQIQTFKNICIT